uniref:Uncharacterized protein n=1 Tax=Strigamia maritima TaxID=126957 RepID=T1J0K5_STRMM
MMELKMDDGIVPLGMLLAIVVRWGVSLYPHSGQGKPPMYGDYEAQRHWQEITWNLSPRQWYLNSTKNDLMYWGLDYPPLTAYHSYLCGFMASRINPDWIKLFASRGTEDESHKLFMRFSVFFVDVLIYMSAVLAYWLIGFKTLKRKSCAIAVMLMYPGLILIDHGHFQYPFLGLTLWAIVALKSGHDFFATIAFCCALNYKQMELYHALPFFSYLLGLCVKISPTKGFLRVVKLGSLVIAVFLICWFPFLRSWKLFNRVLLRLFPFNRGLFEDKVANVWCVISLIIKVKNIFTISTLAQISLYTTAIACFPSAFNLFVHPGIHRFKLALINISLCFFLFSYQVHEKSILLVALMFPLFVKDGLTLPYFATSFLFIILAGNAFLKSEQIRQPENSQQMGKMGFYLSLLGALSLNFLQIAVQPPEKYPDIHTMLNCVYSFVHFILFLLYFHWKQFTCSDIWQEQSKKRLQNGTVSGELEFSKVVRVLYDFEGQAGSGELTIFTNDVLNVTRQDVGEGWWEGTNAQGVVGLFPEAYVETLSTSGPPSMPPPPLPPGTDDANCNAPGDFEHHSVSCPSSPNASFPHPGYDGDDWDDDWDEDDDDDSHHPTQNSRSNSNEIKTSLALPNRDVKSSSTGDVSAIGRDGGKGAMKKNFNRFSTFVKSGGEAFILGQLKISVQESEKIYIMETTDGIMWDQNPNPFYCVIASPKKESKLKGLKSYIAYQITPTFNNIQVSRRYKHFDWLHQRLEEKFTLIPVPPLPDKQISGRYEEQFIEHRMIQLQSWVNRITRHPVLSRSEVFKHFLVCTDEKKWKAGKRRAEKDELVGASFFMAIQTPETQLDSTSMEQETEHFSKFIKTMDDAVKQLQTTVFDQMKKHTGPYKREYSKVGSAFRALGVAFEADPRRYSQDLTKAIKHTGDTYDDIGKLFEDQPKYDLEVVADVLHEYKGILAAFPEILTGALQKKREYEKLKQEGRMDINQVEEVCKRTDVVCYAAMAELTHFQCERVTDFKEMMQTYLKQQMEFYQKIVNKLQESLAMYSA